MKNLNHVLSKRFVEVAGDHYAALVFEDLSSIHAKKKQHRSFGYALHSWSFYGPQQFVEYRAKLPHVPVLYVDPVFTSQDCPRCGARRK